MRVVTLPLPVHRDMRVLALLVGTMDVFAAVARGAPACEGDIQPPGATRTSKPAL